MAYEDLFKRRKHREEELVVKLAHALADADRARGEAAYWKDKATNQPS